MLEVSIFVLLIVVIVILIGGGHLSSLEKELSIRQVILFIILLL